jgi:hypothetical protein
MTTKKPDVRQTRENKTWSNAMLTHRSIDGVHIGWLRYRTGNDNPAWDDHDKAPKYTVPEIYLQPAFIERDIYVGLVHRQRMLQVTPDQNPGGLTHEDLFPEVRAPQNPNESM